MPTLEYRRRLAARIVQELKKLFPEAKTALNYSTEIELLFAVVLSAQQTDRGVNETTDKLFKKYRSLQDYIDADPVEFKEDISGINYFKNKARNILSASKILQEKFSGKVPKTVAELITLPGVGRKTAIVVQGVLYGKAEGVAVDTHVIRLSQKLGLAEVKDPKKIEQDLMQILPQEEWRDFSLRMIDYGRSVCTARPHKCEHPLTKIYDSFKQKKMQRP